MTNQEAINFLKQEILDYLDTTLHPIVSPDNWYVYSELHDMVSSLPSAQPEIVKCWDCKHRVENKHYGERGYIKLKAMCELDTGDPFELGRNAEDDEWFCADGERREE